MYHNSSVLSVIKKCRRNGGIFYQFFLLTSVFTLLVGNAAAGLAGGLARSLAFTAAAVLGAFAEITGFERFDSFHDTNLHFCLGFYR